MKRLLVLVALLAGCGLSPEEAEKLKPPRTAAKPDASWTAPRFREWSGEMDGATVYRRTDELGNVVYWTDRGGVFVVPGAK